MRVIRDVVELAGKMSGKGVSMTVIHVSSTNASNVRLLVIVLVGSCSIVPVMLYLATALSIRSIVSVQMIGEAPLPWPHPNRGLAGVDS